MEQKQINFIKKTALDYDLPFETVKHVYLKKRDNFHNILE